MSDTKNIFISHVQEDESKLADLKSLLSNKGLTVRDSSVTSAKPNDATNEQYIKYKILAPQIDWASTLIVYVSPQTKESPWVNWEIEYAATHGKRVIGVWERGAAECQLPLALEEYADAMVGWHGDSIVDALIGGKDRWESPDGGTTRTVPLKRHPC